MNKKTIIKKMSSMNILAFWFADSEKETPDFYYTIDVKTVHVDIYLGKENVYKINKVDFLSGNFEHMETIRELRTNSIKPTIDKIITKYRSIN